MCLVLTDELQLARLDLDDALSMGHQMLQFEATSLRAFLSGSSHRWWKNSIDISEAAMGRDAVAVAVFLDGRGVEEDAGGRDGAAAAALGLNCAYVARGNHLHRVGRASCTPSPMAPATSSAMGTGDAGRGCTGRGDRSSVVGWGGPRGGEIVTAEEIR